MRLFFEVELPRAAWVGSDSRQILPVAPVGSDIVIH
ncbi:Uncharacterised protein [Vibrio cholerae]|nr:Uncharacterised protein [Vibrio cholerae]